MLYTKTHSKMANLGNNTDTLGSSDINELLDISDLTYLATPESNVVTSRQQIKQSMNEKYKAGEIITFVLSKWLKHKVYKCRYINRFKRDR